MQVWWSHCKINQYKHKFLLFALVEYMNAITSPSSPAPERPPLPAEPEVPPRPPSPELVEVVPLQSVDPIGVSSGRGRGMSGGGEVGEDL